jgi:hypothetical protein
VDLACDTRMPPPPGLAQTVTQHTNNCVIPEHWTVSLAQVQSPVRKGATFSAQMIADAIAMLTLCGEHVETRDRRIVHRLSGLQLCIPGREVKRTHDKWPAAVAGSYRFEKPEQNVFARVVIVAGSVVIRDINQLHPTCHCTQVQSEAVSCSGSLMGRFHPLVRVSEGSS